ncbi:MAG TPA: YceI family protein [Bacteroidia bacterium]|jgi:polyisoprenoid-binding protein YceI|nr:YceI family protein [Bacteroidia bacterium]
MKTIQKTAAAALTVMALSTTAQTNWKVDASHSKLGFSVTHLMVSETEGKFKVYEGSVTSKSETDFTDSKIEFSVDVNSINTDDEKRDGHLKSPDFFDAEKFPKMIFKANSMKAGKVKGTYDLEGDLTMHGVTKKVKLLAVGASKTVKDPWGNTKYAFKVTGKINRTDFGLKWNAVLEAGGVVVSEEVKIDCTLELAKA